MQKHVNCGAFGSVDKITCHIIEPTLILVRRTMTTSATSSLAIEIQDNRRNSRGVARERKKA